MDCVGLEGLTNYYLIPNWPNIQNKIPTWHVRLVDLMLGPTLGLGHLGHGLGPPNIERPPNIGVIIFIFYYFKTKRNMWVVLYIFSPHS